MNAFPCHPDTPSSHDGMSLRDYFAAKAMQSIIVNMGPSVTADDAYDAKRAYEYADAMMKAREQE